MGQRRNPNGNLRYLVLNTYQITTNQNCRYVTKKWYLETYKA